MRSRGFLRAGALLAAVTAVAVAAGVRSAGATDATPTVLATTLLPVASYADIAVAAGGGHVFVSGGRGTAEIAVTDLDGQVVGTVGGQEGATGLALSPDGTTLYAALGDADSVTSIDTATLAERARYPLGAGICPSDLAFAGGKLWFSYGCDQGAGRIGSLDLRGPAAVVALDQAGSWSYPPPQLGSASADQGVLVAGRRGTSPAEVTSFDVSSGQAVARASVTTGEFLQDLEVTPDGAHVLVVTYDVRYPLVFSTADMSEVGYYNSSFGTTQVELRPVGPDGQVLTATPEGILDAFAVGENRKVWISYEGVAEQGLELCGLAWAPDGRRVYAVSNLWGGQPRLRVLAPPPGLTSIAAEVVPSPARAHRPLTISGQLATEDNTWPGSQTIHVTRQDPRGLVSLPDVTTAVDGTFRLTDVPKTTGETVYILRFDGTDVLDPAEQAVGVVVVKR